MEKIRSRFRDLSIKGKVMLVTCTASVVALFTLAGGLYAFQLRNFRAVYRGEMQTLARIMAENCAAPLASNDAARTAKVVAPLRVKPEIESASVIAAEGKVFASFGGSQRSPLPHPGERASIVDRGATWTVLQPILLDGVRIGTFLMNVDFAHPRSELQRVYLGVTAAVLGGSLLLVILLTMRLQGFIVRPIRLLATASEAVARDHDYSVRVASGGADEFGQLTTTFNKMLARIEEQDDALKQAREQLQGKVIALKREIVERRQAEGARARFTAILEATPDFVSSTDIAGRVLYLNSAARTIVGIDETADISKMKASDFHPEWAARIIAREGMPRAVRDGAWSGKTAIQNQDGREIHVSQVIIAHKNDRDTVDYFSTVMRDITDQRAAEEALRVAELKFRSIVEQLPAITYHASLGATGTWSYVSPQVFPLLGYTQEEWLASDQLWSDLIHPDDRSIPLEAEAVALRTGNHLAEYRMFTREGELRWFRDQAVMVADQKEGTHALYGVMMDITEAKAAAANLEELNQQLVKTSRHAGMAEVATGVLHNVGNVLNSVTVSAGLVAEKLRRSKAPKVAKAAALMIQQNGNLAHFITEDPNGQKLPSYLAKLGEHLITEHTALLGEIEQLGNNIEHIKEVVAMQQNYAKVSGVFENLPLDRLVEDAIAMNYGAFERHGVAVERHFAPAPHARVDRHKVLQILINLIRNAKYALDDVDKPDKTITISIDRADDQVLVAVADNGIGIPAENLDRIFGHGFTTRKTGHGFGLHSGALAAKEIGGSLSVHSDGIGHGATFTLALQVAATPAIA